MSMIVIAIIATIFLAAIIYFSLSFKEKFFLIGVFSLTLTLTGLCIYFTILQVQLFSKPTADSSSKAVFSLPKEEDPFSSIPNNFPKDSIPPIPKNPNPTTPETNPNPVKVENKDEFKEPSSPQEFEKIILSPQRDYVLIQTISRKGRYCYFALQKILYLQLHHLGPQLRRIYEQHKETSAGDEYFLIQLLRALWNMDPNSLLESEKEWLKKRGIVLKQKSSRRNRNSEDE